jgi:hypothetical protein
MKKSNARFFHGEPVFSGKQPLSFPNGQKCMKTHFSVSHYPHPSFHIPLSGATGATGASTLP